MLTQYDTRNSAEHAIAVAQRDFPIAQLEESDEQVIQAILENDSAAFERLMRRYNQRLFRVARAVVKDDTEAEDVVQEAYMNAFASLRSFEGRARFSTWITRITYHEALRRKRAQSVRTRHLPSLSRVRSVLSRSTTPDDTLNPDTKLLVCEAFDQLQPMHRSVLMLRLVEGLSTQETAECLQISDSNVKVQLHRAKKSLERIMRNASDDQLIERFSFAGHQCDSIVHTVLSRLKTKQKTERML